MLTVFDYLQISFFFSRRALHRVGFNMRIGSRSLGAVRAALELLQLYIPEESDDDDDDPRLPMSSGESSESEAESIVSIPSQAASPTDPVELDGIFLRTPQDHSRFTFWFGRQQDQPE